MPRLVNAGQTNARPRAGDGRPNLVVTYVCLGIIVVSLVALVVVPLLGQRYARAHQQQLRGAAEPARGLITDIHLALALGGDALHDFVSTGDTSSVTRYRYTAVTEERAYAKLGVLSEQLGAAVQRDFAALRQAATRWHENVDAFLEHASAGDWARGRSPTAGLYEDALIAAARLDDAITRTAQFHRQRILAAERIGMRLTMLLVVMALLALVMAAWVGRRFRLIAEEAEERRHEVEKLMDGRARLVRGLSHDLRNPLNVIYCHAELLEDGIVGEPSPGQKKSLGHIRRSVRALLGLLDDLLELWRAETGDLQATSVRTDVVEVIWDVSEAYRAVAESAGHSLQLDMPSDVPLVETDARRVRQILGNLISNAVKYTPPGGCITIRPRLRSTVEQSQRARWISVEVIDTGPGIPREKLDLVFDEFVRLQPRVPGVGLGLAISRRIARLLGGDVTAESTPGRGSTFALWLPVRTRARDREVWKPISVAHTPPGGAPERARSTADARIMEASHDASA